MGCHSATYKMNLLSQSHSVRLWLSGCQEGISFGLCMPSFCPFTLFGRDFEKIYQNFIKRKVIGRSLSVAWVGGMALITYDLGEADKAVQPEHQH